MKLDEIRKKFLDYFKRNGHEIVSSSSVIPVGDPTLMFTNAGMNQFKDVFLGAEKRDYKRASTSQKCFRASGKHNDLENVGRTARHHTFFEMLGNFSFGDYFKDDAINFAWEFMTKEMALPKDKLYVSVYKDDDDAYDLWKKIAAIPDERLIRLGEKDNFWSMGNTGPCGPCSEIHIDQGAKVGCGSPDCGLECECDRYLELWNLVFMQYNRDEKGEMTPLPHPSIDTGMGVERIAAVMQGVYSNYDTDLFQDIIKKTCELTDKEYGDKDEIDVSLRVVADHARAMSFLISDGIMPSNEGRGYVLRRVMRRAGRHIKMLGKEDAVLYKITNTVGELMGGTYPELVEKQAFISEVVQREEEKFLETLDSGLKILQEEVSKITEKGDAAKKQISGGTAFKLYDTYGFPLDLTEIIAAEKGLEVDVSDFKKEMEVQKERARKNWKGSGEEVVDSVYKEIMNKNGPVEFVGYSSLQSEAKVVALIEDKKQVDKVDKKGIKFRLITDRTPFYGESGGQVGDTGNISDEASGTKITVTDTIKPVAELTVHECVLDDGSVSVGQTIKLVINNAARNDIARNHSATHLLQYALRKIVGDHVQQKGSLVAPDRFRFDLTHFSPVTDEQKTEIEVLVNELIRNNCEVNIEFYSHREALEKGAIALFGEKYGETVRMVRMGDYSKELCGGTHVNRTGDIGSLIILSESGVASGVRRIEAVTGRAAVEHVQKIKNNLNDAAQLLKAKPAEISARIEKLQTEIKNLKKELKNANEKKISGSGNDVLAGLKEVNGINILTTVVEVSNPKELRTIGDDIKNRIKSGVAVVGASSGGKAHILAVVTKDLTGKFKAGDIVKEIAPIVGGKGGGRPDFAQAGGQNPAGLEKALKKAEEILSS
jgi:alanyl-tRNA synthetase